MLARTLVKQPIRNYLRDEDLKAILDAVEKREFKEKFAFCCKNRRRRKG